MAGLKASVLDYRACVQYCYDMFTRSLLPWPLFRCDIIVSVNAHGRAQLQKLASYRCVCSDIINAV